VSIVDPQGHQMISEAPESDGSIESANPRGVVGVSDRERLRTGTRRILDDVLDFTVVGEAADGDVALQAVAASQPDVVLIDIRLPISNGINRTLCPENSACR
jgi:CheY-like chemotaxis protein